MDRICQHSTLVFACNVTVLLIIAVLTDYWEYRIFNVEKITKYLENHTKYRVVTPNDTQTYILIESISINSTAVTSPSHFNRNSFPQDGVPDQTSENVQFQIQSAANGGVVESLQSSNDTATKRIFVALYTQYGNLYRDCDALSTDLRRRLGLDQIHEDQCFNFILNHRLKKFSKEQDRIDSIELASFLVACASILVIVVALALGFIGILLKKKCVVVMCGVANLLAGLLLTSALALFHYKLDINHQLPFAASSMEVPAREIINQTRVYRFGWSFYLAWSSVGLCLFTSWIWFVKARDFPRPNPLLKSSHSHGASSAATHRKQCPNGFDSDSNQDTDDDHLDEETRRKKKILSDSLSLEIDFH